jgi:hypothetical protein
VLTAAGVLADGTTLLLALELCDGESADATGVWLCLMPRGQKFAERFVSKDNFSGKEGCVSPVGAAPETDNVTHHLADMPSKSSRASARVSATASGCCPRDHAGARIRAESLCARREPGPVARERRRRASLLMGRG